MRGIDNKIAVITGASQGLGKAMALELAKFVAKVVIASRKMINNGTGETLAFDGGYLAGKEITASGNTL